MRNEYVVLGVVWLLALLAVLVHFSFWNDFSALLTPLDQANFGALDPLSAFTGQAISLLRTGTFNYNSEGYLGLTQRGPVYPTILAGGLLILGERAWSVLVVNMLLLWGALFFLWCIAKRFVPGLCAFVPSALLAVYWEVSTMVTFGSYEMFALFVATFFVLSLFRYNETKNILWLAVAAIAISLWTLEKPVVLFLIPLIVIFITVLQWPYFLKKRVMAAHVFVFIILAGVIVGAWSWRNYKVLGTRELGTGGVILLRRASQADFTLPEIISMGLSFAVGDYIGEKLYSSFPREGGLPAEPKTWDPAIEKRLRKARFYGFDKEKGFRWMVTDLDGTQMTRVEFDARMKQEAVAKIKEKPLKFFLVSFANLFRLNSPPNYGSQEIMHVFVGAHDNIPPVGKIGIILILRGIWYAFLALVILGIVRHSKEWQTWGLVVLIILYYNGMYAFFTHAEVRYVLTAIPFYLIFFTDSIRFFYEKYSTRRT